LNIGACFGILKVKFRGSSNHQPTGQIFGQPGYFIREPGYVKLTHIGQQQINKVSARAGGLPLVGAGQTAGVQGFVKVNHLHQLVLGVGSIAQAVVIQNIGHSPYKHIPHTHLAAAITLPVVSGKALYQHSCELCLPAHENPFPGNENIFKYYKAFLTTEPGVAHINASTLQLPGVRGLPAQYVDDARAVAGHCKGDGVVRVFLFKGNGGHDYNFMGV